MQVVFAAVIAAIFLDHGCCATVSRAACTVVSTAAEITSDLGSGALSKRYCIDRAEDDARYSSNLTHASVLVHAL